jgi:hypothetical protein
MMEVKRVSEAADHPKRFGQFGCQKSYAFFMFTSGNYSVKPNAKSQRNCFFI